MCGISCFGSQKPKASRSCDLRRGCSQPAKGPAHHIGACLVFRAVANLSQDQFPDRFEVSAKQEKICVKRLVERGGEFNRAGSTATGHGLIGVRQCMQSRNLVLRGCCLCCLSPLQTSKPRTSKNCCRHHSPSALMACCVLGQDRWEQPAVGFEPGDPLQISR